MQVAVLATPCFTLPVVNKTLCTGLPVRRPTVVTNPTLFGLNLSSPQAFAWFSLGMLFLSILAVRMWRDRGVARRLVAVRDNEIGAAGMGIPVLRTKLLAFGLSGFMAGYAGVLFAFATGQLSTTSFDPTVSFLVISMVVIGGLGSIPGAILGALYLEGLPALFGSNPTIQFLTSGLGLIAFILYLPGGLAEVLHRLGDVITVGIRSAQQRYSGDGPDSPAPDDHLSEPVPPPSGGPRSTRPWWRDGWNRDRGPVCDRHGGGSARVPHRAGPPRRREPRRELRRGARRGRRQLHGRAGVHRRPDRRQRVGQDDHARHDLGPGPTRAAARCSSTVSICVSTCPRSVSAPG